MLIEPGLPEIVKVVCAGGFVAPPTWPPPFCPPPCAGTMTSRSFLVCLSLPLFAVMVGLAVAADIVAAVVIVSVALLTFFLMMFAFATPFLPPLQLALAPAGR